MGECVVWGVATNLSTEYVKRNLSLFEEYYFYILCYL